MNDDKHPESVELVDGLALDPQRLPQQFRHLVPLMRKWSVGDDVERVEREAQASMQELQELYDAVAPLFSAINAYLDELDASADPYPDEGSLVGRLAEAATEVQMDLERRKKRQSREGQR